MASETIVAVYDNQAHAEQAIAELQAAGIPSASIQHYTRDEYQHETYDPARTETGKSEGLWAWLTGETEADHHHAAYEHSLQGGSTVVTVVTEQAHADSILSILEAHSPVDLEERAAQTSTMSAGSYTETASGSLTGASSAHTGIGAGTASTEEVIPLSEESIQIGKREVDRGTTRVRRYVVERPVEEQIRLRDERVSVFRRPVTDATVGAGAFTDKTIEVRETAEEAVVAKTARVVEEVVVQKGVEERAETIRDTVRREEVEITGPSATVDSSTSKRV